jgi:beta-glucosidase
MKEFANRPSLCMTILLAVAAIVVAVFSSVFAQNAPPGSPLIGAYPAGPGGRDTPMQPTPRPNPLPPFYDPRLPVAQRVQNIVSLLSLEEKVSLMQMASPSIPRLGIAPYHWWTEALHGMTHDLSTVFPQAIGLSATWDTDLHFKVASAISTEGRAKNFEYRANNIYNSMTGLDFWSPNVNIFRDPRWGRGQETYGEDPYLSGRFAIAFVKGIQGDDPVYFKAIATPKHFAVHSGPEPERHGFNAAVTDQDLYTTYLPQFEAAFREGKAHSTMSAYNAVNGVPVSCNKRLLTDILRTQWGFQGYVVGDDGSVGHIYTTHRYLPDGIQASAAAIKAGNDLDSGTTFAGGAAGGRNIANVNLVQAVKRGLIAEKEIDVSLSRLMEARVRLGEFDPPGYEGNPYNKITAKMYNTPEHHELALQAARETMVLLKNANRTLPLKTNLGTIAVMGPNANSITMQYGNYNGRAPQEHQITILDGIRKAIGSERVLTLRNLQVPLTGNIALAEVIKPEYLFTNASKSKHGLAVAYAADAAGLANPAFTEVSEGGAIKRPEGMAFDPSLAAKMTGVLVPPITGEYQIGAKGSDAFRISIGGKVVLDQMQGGALRVAGAGVTLEKDKAYDVVVEFVHSAAGAGRSMGGARGSFRLVVGRGGGGFGMGGRGSQTYGATPEAPGIAATSGANDPLFQIAWTRPTADGFPANTAGQSLYGEAVDIAQKADAIVLVVGIDGSQEGEMRDRSAIELPAIQEGLIRAVTRAAGKKPVIVVNCSGSPIALNYASENVPAIIQAWYPGQRGDAVADVLFGKYNPAGRLPVTFYKATSDLPPLSDYAMYNRTYRYNTRPVLYPFGHGLSYSTFAYSNLSAPAKAGTSKEVKVTFNVKNTSAVDGDEVVQCYLNRDLPPVDPMSVPAPDKITDDQATLLAAPRKALVGFARVSLKAGESKSVTFIITTQQLSLVVGKDGKREVRPGNLQIQVGGSSAIGSGTLIQTLALEGAAKTPEYLFIAPVIK